MKRFAFIQMSKLRKKNTLFDCVMLYRVYKIVIHSANVAKAKKSCIVQIGIFQMFCRFFSL